MISSGLVSVTFRQLSPPEIIILSRRAGLAGIEWGGDVHVPQGDTGRAREVRAMTEDAGLSTAAYGSYFRLGRSVFSFEDVLETTLALGAPLVRIWAGDEGSNEVTEQKREGIVVELQNACELANRAGVQVGLEFHGGTLTDTARSARQLLIDVSRANLRQYWQPPVGVLVDDCVEGLKQVTPYLGNLHVFHWGANDKDRRTLEEGAKPWLSYLRAAAHAEGDRYALLEFVKQDSPGQFLEDAKTLGRLLEQVNP